MYEVDGWHKEYEQDDYEKGCTGNYSCFSGNDRFSALTIPELLIKLRAFVGVDDDYEVELDAGDDDGRVDISVLETDDSYTPTENDIARWKRGEQRLWYSTYTFYVREVIRRGVRLNDLLVATNGEKQ